MNAKIVLSIVALVAVVAVGGALYYVNRPAAEEASIDNALTALEQSDPTDASRTDDPAADPDDPDDTDDVVEPTETPTPAGQPAEDGDPDGRADGEGSGAAADQPAVPDDASGTWVVDTSIGEFNFADATSSFVGFRVDEELRTVGQTEAVGRTPSVAGELTIDGSVLTTADIQADFSLIASDVPNRDGAMRRAMGVAEHPTGTFTLTEPVDFGAVPSEGETISFTAAGELTVNGISNPVELDMEAQVADANLLVVGRTPVVFADYGITAPQAGPVVSIEDDGTVEVQLWFSRA